MVFPHGPVMQGYTTGRRSTLRPGQAQTPGDNRRVVLLSLCLFVPDVACNPVPCIPYFVIIDHILTSPQRPRYNPVNNRGFATPWIGRQRLIPQDTINEILEKLDIVETVSQYMQLRKAGRNFRGLCPFHPEKTPSFFVNPEKQIFHCFGCGTGGNLIQFLMRIDGLEFLEAVAAAAEKAGVHVAVDGHGQGEGRETKEIFEANAIANGFFRENLEKSHGTTPFEHLEKRGIPQKEFARFSIGYAPSGNAFARSVTHNRHAPEPFVKAGLLSKSGSTFSDYFRHRVILPIFDARGRIAGFGGRSLEENQQPKYLNSAEHRAFKKSSILYGLNWAKERIRSLGFAILVEGYFDVLKLHLAGFDNAIAPMGTYVTDSHLRQLKRFAEKILVVFDADQAGNTAAVRTIEVVLSNGFDVRIATLPRGFDPDDFIDNYGAASFTTFLNQARDFVEYKVAVAGESGLSSVREKSTLASEVMRLVRFVPDDLERAMYVKKLAELTGIEPSLLREKSSTPRETAAQEKNVRGLPEKNGEDISSCAIAERLLIEVLISKPAWCREIAPVKELLPERLGRVLDAYDAHSGDCLTPAAMVGALDDPELASVLSSAAVNAEEDEEGKKRKIFDDCLSTLCKAGCGKKILLLNETIRDKVKQGVPYLEELQQLQKLHRQIKNGGL